MSVPSRQAARRRPEKRIRAGASSALSRSAAASITRLVGLAVVVAGALLLLGQLPRHHPILPEFHVTLPSVHHAGSPPSVSTTTPTAATTTASSTKPSVRFLRTPRFAGIHTTLSLRGHTRTPGTVIVKGSWGGLKWKTLARAKVQNRTYSLRVYLGRRGQLHLRVLYPDGARAVGSIHVS